jgi:hypothetical protein
VLLAKSGLLVEAALVDGASEAVDRQTPMAPLRRQARAHVAALLAGAGNGDAIARARRTGESLDEAGLEAVLLRVF